MQAHVTELKSLKQVLAKEKKRNTALSKKNDDISLKNKEFNTTIDYLKTKAETHRKELKVAEDDLETRTQELKQARESLDRARATAEKDIAKLNTTLETSNAKLARKVLARTTLQLDLDATTKELEESEDLSEKRRKAIAQHIEKYKEL